MQRIDRKKTNDTRLNWTEAGSCIRLTSGPAGVEAKCTKMEAGLAGGLDLSQVLRYVCK